MVLGYASLLCARSSAAGVVLVWSVPAKFTGYPDSRSSRSEESASGLVVQSPGPNRAVVIRPARAARRRGAVAPLDCPGRSLVNGFG